MQQRSLLSFVRFRFVWHKTFFSFLRIHFHGISSTSPLRFTSVSRLNLLAHQKMIKKRTKRRREKDVVENYWFYANPNICLYLKYVPINRIANCSEGIRIYFCWNIEHSFTFREKGKHSHAVYICTGVSYKFHWDKNISKKARKIWIMRFLLEQFQSFKLLGKVKAFSP